MVALTYMDEESADASSDDDNQLQIDDLADSSESVPQNVSMGSSEDSLVHTDEHQDIHEEAPPSPDSGVRVTEEPTEPEEHVTEGLEDKIDTDEYSAEPEHEFVSTQETSENLSQESEKEEGELEEGELEEDEQEAEEVEESSEVAEQRPPLLPLPTPEELSQTVAKVKKDKELKRKRERNHEGRDKNGSRKRRTRPHEEGRKKRRIEEKDKPLDFDTLLKEELYKKSTGNAPDGLVPDDPENEEEEEGDSCSGEEQEGRRRHRRSRKRSRSGSQPRKSDILCMFFSQGACQSGPSCPYSHDISKSGRKIELCKFYMMDCCAKKEKCLYLHKDFPCKYYHFGMKCQANKDCKFSHNPLQDPTKNILLKHIELAPKDILGKFPRLSKPMAHAILEITLAWRRKNIIDDALVESALEMEGIGFKYLDYAIKDLRKRTGIPKIDRSTLENKTREEEKEKHETSPRKRRTNETDDRKDSDKEKPRERDRYRDRHRDRGKERFHDRERHRSDRKRDREQESGHGRPPYKEVNRDPRTRLNNQRSMEGFDDPQGDPYDYPKEAPKVLPKESRDPRLEKLNQTWYSNDEDVEARKASNSSESRSTDSSNLATSGELNVDYGMLENALKTVQCTFTEGSSNDMESQNSLNSYQNHHDSIADDIREVFNSGSKPPVPATSRNLTDDLNRLIETVKEKSKKPDRLPIPEDSIWPYEDDDRQSQTVKHPPSKRWCPEVPFEGPPGPSDSHSDSLKEAIDDVFSEDTNMNSDTYGVDLRKLNMPPTELEVPFSKPMESLAMEIDGMKIAGGYMHYQLIRISIPKPDFSNLHIDPDDPKNEDDPRIMKILKSFAESPGSPPRPSIPKPQEMAPMADPIPNRDPRAQRHISNSSPPSQAIPQSDPRKRVDPRTVRTDPRMARTDPNMTGENPNEQVISGIPFAAPDQGYFVPKYPNVPGPYMPGPGDPRGRPGLLGPAPGHKPLLGPMSANAYVMDPMGNPFPQDGSHVPPFRSYDSKGPLWPNPPYGARPQRDMDPSYGNKMS